MVEDDAVALARLVQAAAVYSAHRESALNVVNTFVGELAVEIGEECGSRADREIGPALTYTALRSGSGFVVKFLVEYILGG